MAAASPPKMAGSPRLGRGDALAIAVLAASAIVIALPILRGGYATYIDNSVHMAEIYDLARPNHNGWSEIGFAGFPLGTLHSPLWYPALAWLVRHGVPLPPLYAAALVLGFSAPALAIYAVSRVRLAPLPAGFLAYLVLVQYAMIWGIGSPLGGMWTNCLAYGLLIVLAELHSRPHLTKAQHFASSLLLAVAVLTHLFVLPVVAILAVTTMAIHFRDRSLQDGELRMRVVSAAVAAMASGKYWLTLFLSSNEAATPVQAFRPTHLFARLLIPVDPLYLLDDRLEEGIRHGLHFTEMAPVLLLLGLGLYGGLARGVRRDVLGRAGLYLASSLVVLLLVHRYVPLRFLGPVSWRLVDWIRLALAFPAMNALAHLAEMGLWRRSRSIGAVLVPAGLGLCFWWRIPLEDDLGGDPRAQVNTVRPLWAWLKENAKPEWGRIYLQDTFGWAWRDGGLAQSHLLVLTAHEVGMPQLGTYYGVVPYGLRWTLSEFNSLFTAQNPSEAWITEAMEKTNAGVLVTSSEEITSLVIGMDSFTRLFESPGFSVFRRNGAENHPVAELTPANHLSNVDFRTGSVRFDIVADYPRSRVLLRTLYHPWWRLSGPPGAWLRESPEGFLAIDDIPEGSHSIRVWYEPSSAPKWLSVAGFLALAAWAFLLGRKGPEPERS